ncbi:uncharacterized protein Asx isoform X1 [Bemisia tabaci]|uniref:uncharacterized protein Asx isoform X1 n=1 Tax=Bemisia tabaci TaxID=7038 RepID=UPI003B286578
MDESTSKAGKVTQALSPVKLQKVKVGSSAEDESTGEERGGVWSIAREEVSPSISRCALNHPHSKKVMKHALRQQAKRRRKNTTIAAGNSAPLPRPILVPPQAELEEEVESRVRPATMMEVLNSIPGFTLKPRKRSNKKLSPAAQLEQLQTREGSIDLETPDSILVQTNLRFLLNKHTFASLPPLYQCKLVQLLPHVDRTYHSDSTFRLSASGLNNEFFARALQQWRERLAEGEFTPENQQKLKLEAEKEKSKLDPWKLKHFEPIWGESNTSALHTATSTAALSVVTASEWTAPKSSLKATIKVRPPAARLRGEGAVTRALSSYRGKREAEDHDLEEQPKRSKSDAAHTQTSATVSNHVTELDRDQVDSSSPCRSSLQVEFSSDGIITTSPVASVSPVIPSNISTVEKCSMVVGAASEYTCIIPSEEVFNAPPMEMKSEDLQGHDSDDFIYVDPSADYNESENESSLADTSGGDKDNLLCPVSEANCLGLTAAEDVSTVQDSSTDTCPLQSKSEEEKIVETSETTSLVLLPSPSNGSTVFDEDSVVKSEESIPVETKISEELVMETTVSCVDFVEADNDKVADSVQQEAILTDASESNIKSSSFFPDECNSCTITTNQMDLPHNPIMEPVTDSSTNSTGTDLPDSHPETLCVSPSLMKSGIDQGDDIRLQNSPDNQNLKSPIPEENFRKEEVPSENKETSESFTDNQTLTQESSSPQKLDDPPSQDDSEEMGKPENAANVNGSPHPSPTLEENSELTRAENTLDDETSSVTNTSPQALSESNSEHPAFVDSEPIESLTSSKNTPSSPVVGEINLQESAVNIPAPSASHPSPVMHLSPSEPVNFKEETSENSATSESDPHVDHPLETSQKDDTSAWDGVDSSTDKPLTLQVEGKQEEVAVIPMQEELEVRLEESSLPAPTCEWSDFDKSEPSTNSQNPPNAVPYPGHVKLELEVTLTPEVDNQVSSTVESSGAVIAPTTIVCLPSVAAPPLPPVSAVAVPSTPNMVSSPALPYLALSTSTPVTAVRAIPSIPSKPNVKAGGPSRGSRGTSNKPPPGAVNLERSYQICQAVIQNSPNRDQLRSQLKPPPSTLLSKEGVKTGVLPSKVNRPGVQTTKPVRGLPTPPVLVKHVFTSSQGIPVTMAVLPPVNTPEMTDGGQFLLVQRGTGLSGVRRPSSAPPANIKLPVSSVARNRPASVGIQAITRERFNGADSPVQNIYSKQQSVDSCSCNLNAMVVCQKCGAFCHDDCISSSRLCLTCLIR